MLFVTCQNLEREATTASHVEEGLRSSKQTRTLSGSNYDSPIRTTKFNALETRCQRYEWNDETLDIRTKHTESTPMHSTDLLNPLRTLNFQRETEMQEFEARKNDSEHILKQNQPRYTITLKAHPGLGGCLGLLSRVRLNWRNRNLQKIKPESEDLRNHCAV